LNYVYLDKDDIRDIHDEVLTAYGGLPGEHEPGLIDFMAEKPFQELFGRESYPGLFAKAAVYLHGFATAQYFVDGNKRTGVVCSLTFLLVNGYTLTVSQMELYEKAIDVANKKVALEELASWFENNSFFIL